MMANLGIIDADPSEPPSNEDVISLANRLLGEFSIPTKLENIEHISAALFVILYESLFSERLPGIIREPYTREDEIHNCQTVIDVLSTEIVHDSLSHIRGVDIVSGNITAISNLLDIFSYLLEYVVNKIESDVQTDNEDKDSEFGSVPNVKEMGKSSASPGKRENGTLSHGKLRNEQKLREVYNTSNERQNVTSLNRNENRSTVISHEDFYNMTSKGITMNNVSHKYEAPPSPIQADQSESLLGQKTVDSTYLDGEVEKENKVQANGEPRSSPLLAWTEKEDLKDAHARSERASQEEGIAKNNCASQISNGDVLKNACETQKTFGNTNKGFAASVPISRHSDSLEKTKPFRATVGPIEYHVEDAEKASTKRTYSQKYQEPTMVTGLSSSYNDLKELVEKTATLTRVALRSSPIRRRVEKDLDITDFDDRPRPVISSDGARHAKELNAQGMRSSKLRDKQRSTAKVGKKVAFIQCAEDKEKERFDEKDQLQHFQDDFEGDGGLSCLTTYGYPFQDRDEKSRLKYSAGEKKRTLHVGHPIKAVSHTRKRSQDSSKALALHLARNRQPELGAAHMRLRTEDRAVKKKQDVLRQMYDDNLDEFTDDVDVLISADKQAAEEIEEKMLKSYKNSAAKKKISKPTKTTSSFVSHKKPKMSKTNAKMSRPMSDQRCPISSPALDLKSDEDLLAVLLEEFPHLHLSDHTWHELWRKGLHQIESLTRVYQENKRKKSRAQTQMEEAAERHNLLSNIMNKQLEHAKRLREIKERKTQQVQIRNKTHEKRMQSARARRYYNEYQVRARGKQLKRRTKEEMVFRELFKDALSIQKERINDIRQYTTDQRKRQESRRQDEIDSLENFYHDQFAMLADKLAKEKKENSIRNAAQQQVLDQMKKELRKKMEHEIALYQEQVFRDDDDVHYRQIDADKLRHQLHKACYTSL